MEFKTPEWQTLSHSERNKQLMSLSTEEAEIDTTFILEEAIFVSNKNKSQTITSFLRPSAMNTTKQISPNNDTQKLITTTPTSTSSKPAGHQERVRPLPPKS